MEDKMFMRTNGTMMYTFLICTLCILMAACGNGKEANAEDIETENEEAFAVRESVFNVNDGIDHGKENENDSAGNQDILAAYKLLNQDIFGDLSMDWYSDSLKQDICEYTEEFRNDLGMVTYEGDIFPSGLIDIMEEELSRLKVKGEISDSWYETLDALGADEFRLDLDEMYQLFPELDEYKNEIKTEYDAYDRVFQSADCSGIYHINMTPNADYYVFVYWNGGSNGVHTVRLTKRIDNEFIEVDECEVQNGDGRIIQYENNLYYVFLYKNYNLKCVDGIRIHKLGTDAMNENILIRCLPESYTWKNIYSNDDVGFHTELEEYIDSIKAEITSDDYLENGQNTEPKVYFGDETEEPDFVVEKNVSRYHSNRYHKIDFANIGIPVYMRKSNFIPSNGLQWCAITEFYLYDAVQDVVMELENMDLSYSFPKPVDLVQIWFKMISQQVLTFRVYHISDYGYVLNVMLIEGNKITQIRCDALLPQYRIVLTEGKVFFSG